MVQNRHATMLAVDVNLVFFYNTIIAMYHYCLQGKKLIPLSKFLQSDKIRTSINAFLPILGEKNYFHRLEIYLVGKMEKFAIQQSLANKRSALPKKGNAKECSNYHTVALISHTSKVMFKILQARLQQYVNFQMFKLDLEKAEDPEVKLPTSVDHR